MTQLYMILSAIGCERGQPIGLYYDIFKAQADFAAITDIGGAQIKLKGHQAAVPAKQESH